jgi:hypothetical protein
METNETHSSEQCGEEPTVSISEHKLVWMTCEEAKVAPRTQLKEIAKKQRNATKALKALMEEKELDHLDCGGGWSMTYESVEKVTYNEDVCGPYMDAPTLERLKQEQKKRKTTFKTIPPAKRQRDE